MKSLLVAMLVAAFALILISVPQITDRVSIVDPAALNQRGLACYFGEGVEKDLVKARELFLQAAEQGYAPSQVNLGMMYDHGDGVARDYQQARHWYQKAADQGNRDGQLMLGYMYFYGLGGEDDHKKAMRYFIAANSRIQGSDKKIGALVQKSGIMEVAVR